LPIIEGEVFVDRSTQETIRHVLLFSFLKQVGLVVTRILIAILISRVYEGRRHPTLVLLSNRPEQVSVSRVRAWSDKGGEEQNICEEESPSCRFSPLPVRPATRRNPDPEVQESSSCSQLFSDFPSADWPILFTKLGVPPGKNYDWSSGMMAIESPVLAVFSHADAVRTARAAAFIRLLDAAKKRRRVRWTWNLHCRTRDFWRPLSISASLDRRINRVGILMVVEPAQTLNTRRRQ
jgi:hypothetical protein